MSEKDLVETVDLNGMSLVAWYDDWSFLQKPDADGNAVFYGFGPKKQREKFTGPNAKEDFKAFFRTLVAT